MSAFAFLHIFVCGQSRTPLFAESNNNGVGRGLARAVYEEIRRDRVYFHLPQKRRYGDTTGGASPSPTKMGDVTGRRRRDPTAKAQLFTIHYSLFIFHLPHKRRVYADRSADGAPASKRE